MEFIPSDERAPRRLVRELRCELALRGMALGLDECLDAVARLLGHADARVLHSRMRRGRPSRPDDESADEAVGARRLHQAGVLAGMGLDPVAVEEILDGLRPTARRHARGPGSRSLVGLLDVPHDSCRPLGDDGHALMAELLAREGGLDASRAAGGSGAGSPIDLFVRAQLSGKPDAGEVWRHMREGRYEASVALCLLLGRLARGPEEATLWVAALREMWRRIGGGAIAIGHFAEDFSCGIPTEEAAADIWRRRRSGERTTGFPRYAEAMPEGAVGIMLSRPSATPRTLVAHDVRDGRFMARHAAILNGAPGDPTRDLDAHRGLTAELVREACRLPEGHPDERLAMRLLLWLCLVHPEAGERTLSGILGGATPCLTMTVTAEGRVRTSLAASFEDRTRMPFA